MVVSLDLKSSSQPPMAELRPDLDHDAVVESTARHLVVTAPPGTGKTFLSVRLAGCLVPALPPAGRVLLLTFSTQARSQLEREATRQLTPALRRRVDVSNYHRFFWRGVLAYRRALELPMQLDVGSRRRREEALQRADSDLVKQLRVSQGMIESLAEHAFSEFRDQRTPEPGALANLLAVVEAEQQAGRLVFDDLGALFWSLLERFPTLAKAYRTRYPVVIADEHQDASSLQDALVRRLGTERLVVFADPMQLIHEFRGASEDRLERHLAECDQALSLGTPHRWHRSGEVARWLLAVRSRLQGRDVACPAPPQLVVERSPVDRGFNGMKPLVKTAVSRAFEAGAKTVAVLARGNREVAELRAYLSRQGQYPRQIGTEDFEEGRQDVEQLPLLRDPQTVAHHAVDRLGALVPTLSPGIQKQVRTRTQEDGVNLKGAGREASGILRALEPIYRHGPSAYFEAVVGALDACVAEGHHLPRVGAVGSLTVTAQALADGEVNLDSALERYSAAVMTAANTAPRADRGLLVMTVHQAKGREFEAIVLADASARFWPETDESRRLFYVAITRASQWWTVIATTTKATPLLDHLIGP